MASSLLCYLRFPSWTSPVHRCLMSSKDRLSALVERQHPFPAVFGGDQAGVGLNFQRQTRPQRHLPAPMKGLPGFTYRYRPIGGAIFGKPQLGLQKLLGVNDPHYPPPPLPPPGGGGKG